jgi:hypothetical protein
MRPVMQMADAWVGVSPFYVGFLRLVVLLAGSVLRSTRNERRALEHLSPSGG